ncbi:class I SAM-dependent methyltransferase [Actinokineospora sp. UTMC 2448]|uniref:class I SAM-dependent methyltransferase n=1 Tax=Actinokineospora sp. UTMC 2448 TaxID=2268449 RepID=UPI002164158E|nr:class I SAM-dependent methyltransferase [Actinokineospora sp. UTMC 2448]UVS78686.1 O-methyltransferase PerS5 [Actinokineospora sp. UTMC 2448]
MTTAAEYAESVAAFAHDDVPGWFFPADALLFRAVDELQGERGITGDLLEIGVYQGKSAILIGCFPRAGERFAVCDVFGDLDALSAENRDESTTYYPGYERAAFERNYLRFHAELPDVHAVASARLPDLLPAGSFRFAHIDGGHSYDVVRQDIATVRRLLGPGGVVVLDDWSTSHAPGVGRALWAAFADGGLIPLAFTPGKFYATWDADGLTGADFAGWAAGHAELESTYEHRFGEHTARHYTMGAPFWQRFAPGTPVPAEEE